MATDDTDLPADVVDEVERLTRLARRAVDDNERAAYREERARLLDEHGYECRVRDDGAGETLVCYPAEWLDGDGVLRTDAVEDLSRGVEVTLSGTGDPDEWDAVHEHNRDLARQVRAEHGDVHGDNAEAFAAFMSNHYARRAETAAAKEVNEFREEYYPRNAWPTDEQAECLRASLRHLFRAAGREPPL